MPYEYIYMCIHVYNVYIIYCIKMYVIYYDKPTYVIDPLLLRGLTDFQNMFLMKSFKRMIDISQFS